MSEPTKLSSPHLVLGEADRQVEGRLGDAEAAALRARPEALEDGAAVGVRLGDHQLGLGRLGVLLGVGGGLEVYVFFRVCVGASGVCVCVCVCVCVSVVFAAAWSSNDTRRRG